MQLNVKMGKFVVAALVICVGGYWSPTPEAHAAGVRRGAPIVRGEMARLYRQSYDFYYRNSNRNIFRSSRHFSPTENIFRKSRHYQKKLAASYDGYPVQTTVRFVHHDGESSHVESYSYVYPRRHPTGPIYPINGFINNRRGYPYDLYQGPALYGGLDDFNEANSSWPNDCQLLEHAPPSVSRERREIAMVPITVVKPAPPRPATQRAVLQTIVQPDGSVKTIITSAPIESGIDRAWDLLDEGAYEQAATVFTRHSLEIERGTEAMLGYAIAKGFSGDDESARNAIKRARAIDPLLEERIRLTDTMRRLIDRLFEASEDQEIPGETVERE